MIDLLPSGYHLAFNSQGEQGYHVTAPPAPLVVGLPESVGDADLRQDGRLWQRIGNDNTLWMDNVTTQPVQAVIWTQAHNNTGPHVISWPGYAAVPVSLVQDAWPVAVVVDAPPGLHALPLHVAGVAPPMPGTGNPTPVTVELRSLEPAPIHPLQAQFVQGGETRWVLFGVSADACTIQAGATLDVALLWRVYVPTLTNQTVFVHLVGPDGKLAAQADGPPDAGSVATSMTLATPDVSDAHAVTLPKTLAPGTYQLQAGLYDPTTMVRMPLATSGDTVSLGQINVVPPNDGSRRIPCS